MDRVVVVGNSGPLVKNDYYWVISALGIKYHAQCSNPSGVLIFISMNRLLSLSTFAPSNQTPFPISCLIDAEQEKIAD
jgi:hypothetical protein